MMNVLVYRAVKPAAKLMDMLRFPIKLLVIGTIFVVPAVILALFLTSQLNENLQFVRTERIGVKVLPVLSELKVQMQQHTTRIAKIQAGIEVSAESGDTQINAKIDQIDHWLAFEGAALAVNEKWQSIKNQWKTLQSVSPTSEGVVNSYEQLGDQLTSWGGDVADASNLTLDPVMSTYSIMDVVTSRLLNVVDHLGRLERQGIKTIRINQPLSPMELASMQSLTDSANDALDSIGPGLRRAINLDSEGGEALLQSLMQLQAVRSPFGDVMQKQILNGREVTADISSLGKVIDRLMQRQLEMNGVLIPELDRILAEREKSFSRKLVTCVSACALSGFLAIYVFLGFIRSLAATLRGLRRATARITEGDFPEDINLFSTDEMQDIANDVERVSRTLKQRADEQKVYLDRAEQLQAALGVSRTGLMMADQSGTIQFVNRAVIDMFASVQGELERRIPGFTMSHLIGMPYTAFHGGSTRQSEMLATLKTSHRSRISLGDHYFDLVIVPIFNAQGHSLGHVVEWHERTMEVRMEMRTEELVVAASQGDFSGRIDIPGLDAASSKRAHVFNRFLEAVSTGLNDIESVVVAMADGDFSRKIDRQFKGQLARLTASLNHTTTHLADLVAQIKKTAGGVRTAAGEIAAGNADLSVRTERQAVSLEETAASVDALGRAIQHSAEHAESASSQADAARNVARIGGEVVAQVVQTMLQIEQASRKVAEIISVIDGIAFQTNILALNAAVEAAHAGDQGRGFAVVASEVRGLARRAADSAREIKSLITDSMEKVESGTKLVGSAGSTMNEIVDSVSSVSQIMMEIKQAFNQQAANLDRLNSAVGVMDQTTQQNAALVEQSAACAQGLDSQSEALIQLMARFRTTDEELSKIHLHGSDVSRAAGVGARR